MLERAREDPERALVALYCALHDHVTLQSGLDRHRCTKEADDALDALESDRAAPEVHPVAAMSAVDRFLLGHDGGTRPSPRKVDGHWIVPRHSPSGSRVGESQPNQREFWLKHHQVFPAMIRGIRVEVRKLKERVWKALLGQELRLTTGGFTDSVQPVWSSKSPYSCRDLDRPNVRGVSIARVLLEADERRSALVVLPELTVDRAALGATRTWLSGQDHGIGLVVAGSFHEDVPGCPRGQNRSHVLDGDGRVVFTHAKLQPMRIVDKEGTPADEDLDAGSELTLYMSPAGLLAVVICLDYCEAGDTAVAEVWRKVGPALVLVPSMGADSTNHAHGRRAEELARQHASVTVVASQDLTGAQGIGLLWGPTPRSDAPVLHATLPWTSD